MVGPSLPDEGRKTVVRCDCEYCRNSCEQMSLAYQAAADKEPEDRNPADGPNY